MAQNTRAVDNAVINTRALQQLDLIILVLKPIVCYLCQLLGMAEKDFQVPI